MRFWMTGPMSFTSQRITQHRNLSLSFLGDGDSIQRLNTPKATNVLKSLNSL